MVVDTWSIRRFLILGGYLLMLGNPDYSRADEAVRAHRGRYENPSFGFRVTIPRGYSCLGTRPPSPSHGCTVWLDSRRSSRLVIDAQYDVGLSPGNALDDDPIAERFEYPPSNTLRQQQLRTGNVDGIQTALEYTTIGREQRQRHMALFVKTNPDGPTILYLLYLDCPRRLIGNYLKLYLELVSSFDPNGPIS